MKGYKIFMGIFISLLIVYIIAEINKPQPVDWSVTLSRQDKIPYGSYVVYNRLKDIFPDATIQSYRLPVYDQVNDFEESNTAYILCDPQMDLSNNDLEEMLAYVEDGNYVFLSASYFDNKLLDTLHIKTDGGFSLNANDSTSVQLLNPALHSKQSYTFRKSMIDEYFSEFDTAHTVVLGTNNKNQANFLQVDRGDGKIFIHANPIVFSNYFVLHHNNDQYTSSVLSYIPADVDHVFWDEYYKMGPEGAQTPLRFLLSNEYLRWALRLSLLGMLIFVFFEMKRRQRVIPAITPLRNSTLTFVKTVAGVYFEQKDNKSLGAKKINYFLEFVRNKYYLQTQLLDETFAELLHRKSGVGMDDIRQLLQVISEWDNMQKIPDNFLLLLNQKIDQFYKQIQ